MPTDPQVGPYQHLSYNPRTGRHEVFAPTDKFIKGPIPLAWIAQANRLPGKAGAVGLALWFLAGLQRTRTVKLTREVEHIAACSRKAVYQALRALGSANLIATQSRPGARPVVVIHDTASV